MLILIEDKTGERRRFAGQLIQIGRVSGNDLVLATSHISSRHARIRRTGHDYLFTDLGSTNGSCVERAGQRLLLGTRGVQELALEDGDILVLGDIDRPERWRVELVAGALSSLPTGENIGAAVAGLAGATASNTIVARRPGHDTLAAVERLGDTRPLLPALLSLAESLALSSSRDDVLQRAVAAALELIPDAVEALIAAPAGAGSDWHVLAHVERSASTPREPTAAICQRVLDTGEAVLFGQSSVELPAATLVARGLGGGVAAPLAGADEILAVLQINCAAGQQQLGENTLDLALVLAHHAAVALQKAVLVERLRAAEEALREENDFLRRQDFDASAVVAASPKMRAVLAELDKAAATDVTVLLSGETGTGKEVAARFVHQRSARSERLLVPVNCGALAETLLDSELFGHKKGAFTGAQSDRKGVFEVAQGGTVFLDEIGETPLSVQVRLLRVLEESKIRRVGEVIERSVDVRIIAATNRDLAALVEQGSFRRDLYYRLRVFPVRLPPLRERPEDIPPLVEHFCARFAAQQKKRIAGIAPDLLRALERYPFSGNVRELGNEIERAVVRAESGQLLAAELLSEEVLASPASGGTKPGPAASSAGPATPATLATGELKPLLDAYETEVLRQCLERHGGRKATAAAELGLTRQGLAKKMARLGLE